jgi:outer membrane protein assembly factor BamB
MTLANALTSRAFCVIASLLGVAVLGCDVPQDQTPRLDPTYLPAKGITVIALDLRTLVGIRTKDGGTLWRYQPPELSTESSVARPPGYLACQPILAKNGRLVIGYSDRIAVIDADTGLEVWVHRYGQHHVGVECPAVTADSGVIFVDPQKTQVRNTVRKLDLNGALQWHTVLPDVGLVEGAPQVDDQTGDIVVQASVHVVGLSPEGLVNWIRPRAEMMAH